MCNPESCSLVMHEITVISALVKGISCPRCKALPEEDCYGKRPFRNGEPWRRESAHAARVKKWREIVISDHEEPFD